MLMSKPARSGLAAKAAAAIATISRPRLLACRIWIRVHEEGERGREQKRSANNERRLCADQPPEGVRSGREARRDHGDRHPAEQQAARAEPVRERAEAHKDAREHERVGIDNPLPLTLAPRSRSIVGRATFTRLVSSRTRQNASELAARAQRVMRTALTKLTSV